jgi:Cro/C1-type HTH DNA-binding domain
MGTKYIYKYKLKEKLDLLTYNEYKSALYVLPKALKIHQRTFFRYLYTRVNENYSMPADHLARLAIFFNCKIEDLLNFEPQPLTLKEMKQQKKIEVAKRFKLVK